MYLPWIVAGVSLLCFGCSSTGPWRIDAISAADPAFDSAKLVFQNTENPSPLRVEFVRLGTEVDLYLSALRYPFSPAKNLPRQILVQFSFEGAPPFERAIPLLEGQMRLHIPPDIAEQVKTSLLEGKKVTVCADGAQETLLPERFLSFYEKFSKGSFFLANPFKGPIE